MGQTWVVVAILLGIGVALFFLLQKGEADTPAGKTGKEPSPEKKEGSGQGDAAKASGDSKESEDDAERASEPPPKSSASKDSGEARARAKTVPDPAVMRASSRASAPPALEKIHDDDDDEDDDITIVTLTPRADLVQAATGEMPELADDLDDERGPPDSERATAVPIIYDEEAAEDEPTRAHAVILVAAVGQTDRGQKRKINEDRYLALDEHNLYVVADGMGGHAGGEIASQLAVDTIAKAFTEQKFDGAPYTDVPRRGSELAQAIQMANQAIYERSRRELKLQGMGTTIVSARFTPGKERVYIGHVGDSRCYRFRGGQITQITTDHTMGAIGMTGPFADHLSRAVGIAPAVRVDLVIAKPRHEDVFLLCSDGLSKMVKDDAMAEILAANPDPNDAVKALVQRANERGGRDNITVILVVVKDPTGFAKFVQQQAKKKLAAQAEASSEAAKADAAAAEAKSSKLGAESTPKTPKAEPVAPAEAKSEPEGRPSVPEARKSSSSGRPSVPEIRKSSSSGRPSVPEVRKSSSSGRPSVPTPPPSPSPPKVEAAPDSGPEIRVEPLKEPLKDVLAEPVLTRKRKKKG